MMGRVFCVWCMTKSEIVIFTLWATVCCLYWALQFDDISITWQAPSMRICGLKFLELPYMHWSLTSASSQFHVAGGKNERSTYVSLASFHTFPSSSFNAEVSAKKKHQNTVYNIFPAHIYHHSFGCIPVPQIVDSINILDKWFPWLPFPHHHLIW